jgi:dethiobiotin synthetase
MQPFFITGIDTDIGKTLVTTTLCWQLRQMGKQVTALKPIITGYDPNDQMSDSALILKSCGLSPTPQLMETISPWRYKAQLAPNMAAAHEGKPPVDVDAIVKYCREHAALQSDVLLVEGAGGLMAPINDHHTTLDVMRTLAWPVILVAGNYLGALSHTLTAVEVLRSRGLSMRALIVNQSDKSPVSLEDTTATLQRFIPSDIPIVKMPRLTGKEDLWKAAPLISWIISHD